MEEPTFTIADISKNTGLSYDTIRYYEKIGLLPPAKRKDNGQREYDKRDLDRFIFITHLKRTHMPLKEIERYMTMASDQKYSSCYSVLCEHKLRIESELADMNATLEIMKYKMDHFQDMMKRSGLSADVTEEQVHHR
ncbi:MerR family transcriptional regulator [Paenibacillus sepulcri]|uniref:MerR family transcriptional regulator n=1 Tax=Paenibacillus sepulcri TaxID=359917 RepID=A0ABS7C0U2_9BACL|nr:MerR family transcriptional regulator [Paenibacillus sepulcri]